MRRRLSLALFTIILLTLAYLFWNNKLGGFSPWSRFDANPGPDEIKQWTAGDFNSKDWQLWNANPTIDSAGYNFDSGDISNANQRLAPWGNGGWGLKAYGWNEGGGEKNIVFSRLKAGDGKFYISVRQHGSHYGNGTAIQGWNWGGQVPWYCPAPLNIYGKKLVASLDLKISSIDPRKQWSLTDWVMVGATFWFRSPDLSKPLVVDLGFYINRKIMFSHESASGYHYQRMAVPNGNQDLGIWRHHDIYLDWFINDVCLRYNIPESAKKTLALQSIEILIESKKSGGTIEVDNFGLYYK